MSRDPSHAEAPLLAAASIPVSVQPRRPAVASPARESPVLPLLLIHFLVAHLRINVSPLPGDICLLRKSDLSTLSVDGR